MAGVGGYGLLRGCPRVLTPPTPKCRGPLVQHRRPAFPACRSSDMTRPAFAPRNRVQRVSDRACAECGGPVVRSARGPAPRWCAECSERLGDLRQLRAYLRSAERLAVRLGLAATATSIATAIAHFDRGATR
jgi:hypothetical protein